MNFETICLQSHAIPLPVNAIFELSTFCERTSCVITAPASAQLQRCGELSGKVGVTFPPDFSADLGLFGPPGGGPIFLTLQVGFGEILSHF